MSNNKASLEDVLTVSLMTPMGDPVRDPLGCKMGLPTILWGVPGIGKSFRTEFISLCLSLPVEVILPSTRQPEDPSGAAMPDGKGGVTFVSLLPGVTRLKENKDGVLMLDELSTARPAVQAAFLGVILDRRVGDERLPPGIRILAAANDADDAAGGWELEPPMANRLCHVSVTPPTDEEWVEWLLNEANPDLDPLEDATQRLINGWDAAWGHVRALRAGFGKARKGEPILINLPKVGDPQRGRGWPSPRSWTMALRAMATCKIFGMSEEVVRTFIQGCVGEGVGIEFLAWVKKADLPSPEEALKHGWKPDTRRLDRSVAVYSSVAVHLTQLTKGNKFEAINWAPAAWTMYTQAYEVGLGDIVFKPAQQLVRNGLGTEAGPNVADAAKSLLLQMAKAGFGRYIK